MRRLALVSIVAACGGSPSPAPAPSGPAASIVAPPASEADLVVAQVNGRPVWGSCVAEQAARGAPDRRAALEQCIDFELLAQAAEQRGLATDARVAEATRTAMVSELVATEFEARYQSPTDLGPALAKVVDKNLWRMHRPELRASTYVRANVPKNAPPEVDARAKQIADAIATELADEHGLFPAHLRAAADRHSKDTGITMDSEDLRQVPRTGNFEEPYLVALFSISEVGRVAKPARTSHGWDVILWTGGLPPKESTREQLEHEAFGEVRRAQFTAWSNQLIKASGVTIEIDQAQLAQLDEAAP